MAPCPLLRCCSFPFRACCQKFVPVDLNHYSHLLFFSEHDADRDDDDDDDDVDGDDDDDDGKESPSLFLDTSLTLLWPLLEDSAENPARVV